MEFPGNNVKSFKFRIVTSSIFFFTLVFFNSNRLFAQQIAQGSSQDPVVNYKKLYLHTDRDFYFTGDTLWFKAYYLQGQTHQFVEGLYSLYSELIDSNGNKILNDIWPISNGASMGQLALPDSLPPGDYLLRAYTDLQKEFGEDAFFHKIVKISKIEKDFGTVKTVSTIIKPEIDISFLPEGGLLLAGQKNLVGIKAINKDGIGVAVKGNIINSSDEEIQGFETKYHGMGVIDFTPEPRESYYARIEGYPNVRFDFCDVIEDGIKIEFQKEEEKMLYFQVISNAADPDASSYHFAILNRGQEIFHQAFTLKENSFPIKVYRSALPAGINRFILLDEQLRPVSERLYFSQNYDIDSIQIEFDQETYQTRSYVRCELTNEEDLFEDEWSNISVSVVSQDTMSDEPSLNILSWLLIDSELKGNIESPSDYFIDEGNISSSEKLDFLMLTHGWSRYVWNVISETKPVYGFNENQGISVTGRAEKVIGRKPIVDGDVIMNIYKNGYFLYDSVKTNKQGRFEFNNISFTDSASIFLQAKNGKGKLATEVFLDPHFTRYLNVSPEYLPAQKKALDFPQNLYRQQYRNEKAMTDFLIQNGFIVLDEVTVIGQKPKVEKDDGHFRIYSNPDRTLKITKFDVGYSNVFQYLQGRVAGLAVSGTNVMIHGPGSFGGDNSFGSANGPLYLLDGTPVSSEILSSIPMSQLDKVEILKFSNAAIFGTRGANGVIAVYTKNELDFNNEYIPGTISEKILGYSSYREFYSPKYNSENIQSGKPDNRITLYWNPIVITQDGKASISFFTSDDISRFKVLVEGVSSNRKICLGSSEFEVEKMSSNLIEN